MGCPFAPGINSWKLLSFTDLKGMKHDLKLQSFLLPPPLLGLKNKSTSGQYDASIATVYH
jgi:hypothetical protein